MGAWDIYQDKSDVRGTTKRESAIRREMRYLSSHTPDSLSYHTVVINEEPQDVAIINSDNLNTKTIITMPGRDIIGGSMVQWMDNHWIVTERDANNEVYTKAKMIQCNFLLKWIDDLGVMHEQWCVIEDGTKLTMHVGVVHIGLARGKLRVRTIPLIAGTPLEPRHQNGIANSCTRQWFKDGKDWAISSQASNRGRFNDYPDSGSRDKRLEMGNPKLLMQQGEDIVCALRKRKGAPIAPKEISDLILHNGGV